MKKNGTRTIKYLVGVGIYVAIIVLVIIFGLVPKLSQLSKNQNDLEKAKKELADTSDKRATLEQLSKDKARIDLINNTTLEYLPKDSDSSDFVVKVEALAKQLDVIVGNFSFAEVKTETVKKTTTDENTTGSKNSTTDNTETTTKTTQKAAPQTSTEFTMLITADYGKILQFLEKMETFPRVNVVDSVTISGYTKEKNTMTLKIVGRIFYGN